MTKIPVNLEVIPGGKKYPAKVSTTEEEALVREATAKLRQKFIAYRQTYEAAELSDIDLLAMTAIDISTSHLKIEENKDAASFRTKIQQLSDELKVYLKGQ